MDLERVSVIEFAACGRLAGIAAGAEFSVWSKFVALLATPAQRYHDGAAIMSLTLESLLNGGIWELDLGSLS
jgi:hypothetical protein